MALRSQENSVLLQLRLKPERLHRDLHLRWGLDVLKDTANSVHEAHGLIGSLRIRLQNTANTHIKRMAITALGVLKRDCKLGAESKRAAYIASPAASREGQPLM